jgi:hypothetical protein
MDIDVVIEGVADAPLADVIEQKIRNVCQLIGRPGEWSVLVAPSETRGQWDLGLRGPFGNHFASFDGRIDHLPDMIAERLRQFLERRSVSRIP